MRSAFYEADSGLSACHCFLSFTANFPGNVLQRTAADLRELAIHICAAHPAQHLRCHQLLMTNMGLCRLFFMVTYLMPNKEWTYQLWEYFQSRRLLQLSITAWTWILPDKVLLGEWVEVGVLVMSRHGGLRVVLGSSNFWSVKSDVHWGTPPSIRDF